jgi:hypothetical protein
VRTAPGGEGDRAVAVLCCAPEGGFDSAADGSLSSFALRFVSVPGGSCHAWMWMCSCHVTVIWPDPYREGRVRT